MKVVVLPPEDSAAVRERDGVSTQPYRDDTHWNERAVSINALFTGEMSEEGVEARGWRVVRASDNKDDNGGLTVHRGILYPDEYVDEPLLRQMVEEELGYTYEEIASVYPDTPGSIPKPLRELRDKIDARLLALSRSDGNMTALARALGWPLTPNRETGDSANSRKMTRALARAKRAEQ